jgi:hypothetical protein
MLRFRGDSVQAGELRPAREGQPIGNGELVRLKPLHAELPVCEVEVLHAPDQDGTSTESPTAPASSTRSGTGPARVSTRRYRRNWNVVFGARGDDAGDEADYSVN